jgi:predicted kinase
MEKILMMKCNFWMLIGIPAAGKSTWTNNTLEAHRDIDVRVISTDAVIEDICAMYGVAYHEAHNTLFQFADQQAARDMRKAVERNCHIIWDQTNLTRKSRARKLRLIPNEYHKIAVVFPMPEEQEWRRRLASRPQKRIPEDVLAAMKGRYESPTLDEGFTEIRSAC